MATVSSRGAAIHYQRSGSGPALLLVQGVGILGEGWRPQREGLDGEFSVLAFDNRGIGASEPGREQLSIAAMAADALAIADAEAVERFHLAGHSMGGLIAQEIALGAPQRVLSLALLCTFARGRQALTLRPDILWMMLRTRLGTRAMRRRAFLELVIPPAHLAQRDTEALARELVPLFGRDLADQPPILMRQLRAVLRYDAGPRLAQLASIPTLVASADQDRIARPEFGRELAAAIPGARFVQFQDAGHGVPLERPAEVNALLRAHCSAAAGPGAHREP